MNKMTGKHKVRRTPAHTHNARRGTSELSSVPQLPSTTPSCSTYQEGVTLCQGDEVNHHLEEPLTTKKKKKTPSRPTHTKKSAWICRRRKTSPVCGGHGAHGRPIRAEPHSPISAYGHHGALDSHPRIISFVVPPPPPPPPPLPQIYGHQICKR